MARFRGNSDDDGDTAIDISPLIDCVFILLIFFIVTTVFVEESGIEVERPTAVSGEMLEKNSILIAIDTKGTVVYGGGDIGATGVQPLVKRMLANGEDLPVIIQADKGAPAGKLVRVIDEAKLGGATKVNVATRSKG